MAEQILSLDVESRSGADLKKAGAARYFEDFHADVLCAAFALGDGPVQTWRRNEPPPQVWQDHVLGGGLVSAHNAFFEYLALKHVLGPKYGWAVPEISQMRDTMAQCAAMSIPQSLDGAAQALALPVQKDKDGQRLIRKFCISRKARAGEKPWGTYFNRPEDDPADFDKLVAYCARDVEVERALRNLLVPLSEAEQAVWELTIQMNSRGVLLDLPLVKAMLKITDEAKERLDAALARATNWEVLACSQVSQLTAWLQRNGVPADKLNKNAIEDLLSSDLPEAARRAVEIRKEAAKTSTAKLTAMVNCASLDGRVRGLHLYHGAGTGRWSGRLVQTQNMPRGTGTVKDPEAARADFMRASADWIEITHGSPMSAVSDMLRSCLVASPGHRLLAADYSAIEGRVTAWVAGEDWKLDAFRANDRGEGAGMYELAAAGIFNVYVGNVTKPQRQVGKASELALGFGGGVLAYFSMANIYGIDMAPVFPILQETTDPEILGRAAERYEECLDRGDTGTDVLSREAWIASEVTKVLWRNKHPATVALWKGLQDAARDAVQRPGEIVTYACISYLVRRGFLWCRLPSGRCLAYGAPKVQERETPWGTTSESVTALGVNSVTKKWERFALYGGLLTENCLSGLSEVLTDVGWKRITTVDTSMRVWDGLEFVTHGGLLPRGAQKTINFGGLWLTPDHEVLTFDGWKPAGEADPENTPSPRTGFEGASFWSPSRDGVRGVEWLQEPMDHALRLRNSQNARGVGTFEGADEKLRVSPQCATVREGCNASDVKTSGVRGLAVYAGSVPPTDASSVGAVWRARDIGLRAVELLCQLLGRHGAKLCVWFDARQARQQRRLLPRELPMGDSAGELAQPETQQGDPDTRRADAALRSRRSKRDREDDADVQAPRGLAGCKDVRRTGRDEPRVEPVYDLLNCGPRNRFVARGPGGRPFIVHNCVQAIARDLMAHGMLTAERAGYPIVMTVHDEAVADVPEGHGSLAGFEACLCDLPDWAAGLPLVASGYEAKAYKKD